MNPGADTKTKRFDLVHVRELDQLLSHGQTHSCTALVDLASGAVLSRGAGSELHKPIDDRLLLAFGQTVFGSERSSDTKNEQVRVLCTQLGGIVAVAILMRDSGLFLVRLPGSSRVLSLLVRHRESSASASETVVHARAIRSRVASQKTGSVVAEVERDVRRSYSIWQELIGAIISRLTGAAPPAPSTTPHKAVSLGVLRLAVGENEQVMAGDLFDLNTGAHLDHYRHPKLATTWELNSSASAAALVDLFAGKLDMRPVLKQFGLAGAAYGKVQVQVGERDFYWLRVPYFPAMHIAFDADAALLLYKEPRPNPALDWAALDHTGLNLLRLRIGALLVDGLKTQMFPFPRDQIEFQGLLDQLASLPKDDLMSRLDIGGFAARPVEIDDVTQRCQECIYFLPHRKWCDLPELPVPVEAGWWCRLWKI